jgi:hypothetical protein
MVVSKREIWEPGTGAPKSIVPMKSKIVLATSAFSMTSAVEKASMALAPQPFLEKVNLSVSSGSGSGHKP